MSAPFPRMAKSVELLDIEGVVTVNANSGDKAKSKMRVHPISFLQEDIHGNKQTNKPLVKYKFLHSNLVKL